MIRFLKRVQMKAFRIPADKWRILFLLTAGVFLKSLVVVFWDIGATTLLITKDRLFAMGIDFIGAAVLLSVVGLFLWRLERRKGRDAVGLCLWCLLGMAGSLWFYETGEMFSVDILFIFKYPLYLILTTAYWAVAKRFVAVRFTSLKFLALFCLELVSFGMAGAMAAGFPFLPETVLVMAQFGLIGLILIFLTISDLAPVSAEVFIRKTDGIQDVFERPLLWDILTLSFLGNVARVLAEAVLYEKLSLTGIQPMTVLGLVWGLFGLMGLVMVAALYHTRYIYTTLSGMIIFGMSVIATGMLSLGQHSGPVASGYLMMLLLAHFYLNGYMQILPRLLSGGIGTRLKKRIMTVVIPLAFILCGSICLNLKKQMPAYCLVGIGVGLIIVTIRATTLYAQIMDRLIEMRLWRNGPLMLPYPETVRKLKELLKTNHKDDIIYALRILETANHPEYESELINALGHSLKDVRLFALQQMRRLYRFPEYRKKCQQMLKKDSEQAVRNAALMNLILMDEHPKSYEAYLTDRYLKAGAIAGFLERKNGSLSEARNALKRMVVSKNARDNITALVLIRSYPDTDFCQYVERLTKHPNRAVVRQALLTAGILQDPQSLPRLFRALDDACLQEYALEGLRAYGKAALPPIEKMIMRSQTPILQRKQLILLLGSLSSGEGKQILLRALTIENQKLKKTIVQNILDSAIVWVQKDKKEIMKGCLKKDIERISWLMHIREVFMNAPTHESEEAFAFLLRAIQEDIEDTRELILYQLLLLETNDMFVRAVRILLTDSYELYLPAMGVIQDMMPGGLYQKLKSVLILPLSQKQRRMLAGPSADEAVSVLSDMIVHPPVVLNHWIRATALYALRRLGHPDGIPIAEAALKDQNPVVLEAAIWALVRLQPDRERLHQELLTIPTSRLSHLSLDQLLES